MFSYIFFLIIFFICVVGTGYYFKKIFIITNVKSLGELIILGLFGISFLLTFLHLLIPITDLVNIFFIVIGILLFLINYKEIFQFLNLEKHFILMLIVVSVFLFFNHEPNEDFGFYHLPYVVNFKSEKIIFGLSNLQMNQGWNSLWLNLHTFFSFKFNDYKTIYILNILFYISVNLLFIKNIFHSNLSKNDTVQNSYLLIKYFSIFFLCFFNIKFARLNSYGIDVPSNFLIILSILYFFQTIYFDENKSSNLKFLYILVAFAIMSRISNTLFILLPIYLTFKFKLVLPIIKSKFFIFIFFFATIWVTQQFIYTGCFVFPYEYFCSVEPSWYNINFIEDFKNQTFYVNKSFSYYKGDLSIEEYHSNLNWISTWFNRTKIELLEYLLTFLIPILFLVFKKKIIISELNKLLFSNYSTFILLLVIFGSLSLWFLNSPVIRMGSHFIFLLLFFILFFFFNYFGQLRFEFKTVSIYLLIFITFLFNITKNINRIDSKLLKTNFYPKFQKINYQTKFYKNDDLRINKVLEGNSIQSRVCWNTPFLCTTSSDFNHNIIRSYIFITKK